MMTLFVFFFNDTATTEIYTLSLHDALPICIGHRLENVVDSLDLERLDRVLIVCGHEDHAGRRRATQLPQDAERSEEHTSELQSRQYLVCRLLLEKKKKKIT